ncbi:MAG TPA: MmgE/PrpD family protein [Pseudonocardiaceae bacterium]|jgi:2-methylcitrate dehydratase PrpD|nr:MmgE/PrpD family protein [Pseudonocardiaceae bacterium]
MTRQLADFGASITADALPEEVVHNGRRALVDWLAAALAGAREPATDKLNQVVTAVGPDSGATVVGRNTATSAPFAAFANAYASHLLDFDDIYNPVHTTVHLGSCVWPVVLAIGETRRSSGAAALAAYVAGFETGARVACAAGVRHYESGWHVTGTAGHLAAAGAAANLLGLPGSGAVHALGAAATQAAGIREVYGSDTKALHPAKAALDGVLCGLLAETGFTATETAIEGPMGLLRAVSPEPVPGRLVDGFGERWHVLDNGHKLYPSASLTHPPIDAVRAALADRTIDPTQVTGIEVRMAPFAAKVTALQQPDTGAAAKFSTAHCVAVALLTGFVRPADFTDRVATDPAVAALRGLVRIISDPDMSKRGSRVRIEPREGEPIERRVEQNRGTPADPLTDDELTAKLLAASEPYLRPEQARDLVDRCWEFEKLPDVGEVLRMLGDRLATASTAQQGPPLPR